MSHQFHEELLTSGIAIEIDYREIFIDDLIDNPALKEIPLEKSVVSVIGGGIAVNQFIFAKKLLTFIQTFNSGQLDPDKKRKFQDRIKTEDKYRKRICEQVVVFVDRFFEVIKAKISANMFKAYVCTTRKNLTFHVARHTFATTITLCNGVPIETVSKMLGHNN